MNDRRTKHLLKIIITQSAVGVLMLLLGFSVLFYAEGYRFNFKKFSIIKTGILYLAANQKSAEVYLNNKRVSTRLPYSVNLLSGGYNVEIQKEGYKTWDTYATVDSALVTDYRDIVLFHEDSKPVDLTDERKISLLSTPIDILAVNADNDLAVNAHEIWDGANLVTRFSKPISRAIWYPDLYHILYQQGNQIRVIEKNGKNDTLLVQMQQSTPTSFAVGGRGDELYYQDGSSYKAVNIR